MGDFRIGMCCGAEFYETAAKLGLDYVESDFAKLAVSSDEDIAELIRSKEQAGITIETANHMLTANYRLTVDDAEYAEVDKFMERGLQNCVKVGIDCVVMGSGGARNYPEGVSHETAYNRLVVFLRDHAAPLFEKYGVTCALENLSFNESNILNNLEESYRMVQEVGSPNIKMLVDLYHFGNNNDSLEDLRKAKDEIVHLHIASVPNGRSFPAPNDGDENYKVWFDVLREIGYDKRQRRISLEARDGRNVGFEQAVKDALEALAVYNN